MQTRGNDTFAVGVLHRLAASRSIDAMLADLVSLIESTFDGHRAVAITGGSRVDGDLGQFAAVALESGRSRRDPHNLALVVGKDPGSRLVVAVSPCLDDPRLAIMTQVAAGLLTFVGGGVAPSAGPPPKLSVIDQLREIDRRARAEHNHLVIGLVDITVDAGLTDAQADAERERLSHRIRKVLRPQDRVWNHHGRLLVAQVLPGPHSALLVDRLFRAARAAQALAGVARRTADCWVTARAQGDEVGDLVARAEQGLRRMANLREVGTRALDGNHDPFSVVGDPEAAVVVVDAQRLVRGVNEVAWTVFPEVDRAKATGSVDTDDLTFHHPDGTVLTEDELPAVMAMKTGWSYQERLIGVRYRNHPMHWVLLAAVAVSDPSGRLRGYVTSLTPAGLEGPAVDRRVRDAIDLVPEPLVFLLPSYVGGEITDFVVHHLNSAALSALQRREQDVVGALEGDLNPSGQRLGLVLDYAHVVSSGLAARHVVTLPQGAVMAAFEVSAEPCGAGVLVVARSLAGSRRGEIAQLWDALTGLASRQGLVARLDDMNRVGRGALTLVMCDIDDFSGVNDSLGRLRSDTYLIEVGRALSQVAGADDLVARVGSDEFAVLSPDPMSPVAAQEFAERMRRRLHAGVTVGEKRVTAAASLGVAWSAPGDVPADLLGVADVAMYRSKAAGGDRVTLGHSRAGTAGAVEIESQLRDALAGGQFEMHYQPVIDLTTSRIRGVEALIRWRHPERGVVYPGDFIGVAERRHLIVDIGRFVVDAVCAQVAAWNAALGRPVSVSVNVSSGQLVRPGLAAQIAQRTADWGIPAACLQLEITESQLLNADESALSNLWACRDVGCELAIDDFGTGHAGFDYLRRIPARILKIDKTFIDGLGMDPTDAAIVSGVIALGHGLGMVVVAEGVQDRQQAQVLTDLGCDAGQGWLWSAARPAEEVLPLLRIGSVSG